MKKVLYSLVLSSVFLIMIGCDSRYHNSSDDEDPKRAITASKLIKAKIPTLVVLMNWNDYSETDPQIWHNKIFNFKENSVNRWYKDSTNGNVEFVPIRENSGTPNDGVIIVNMGEKNPGSDSSADFTKEAQWRDTYIRRAIYNSEVVNNVNFASLDLDHNGNISRRELQIIFIVAGGEEAFGDAPDKSIWAHSWSFNRDAPHIDGVDLMKDTGNSVTSGSYSRFGAIHAIDMEYHHKATIGIIVHELGHSLLDLEDYYSLSNTDGSGLGYYDVMSSGEWARKDSDIFDGETPVQFSAYNKIDAVINTNIALVNSPQIVTIKCSSNELIKLPTKSEHEYFLLECRDTTREDSDRAFNHLDHEFTDNMLFALVYQVDTNKPNNYESGPQTSSHHYKVRIIENDESYSLTTNNKVTVDFGDAYTVGNKIGKNKLISYTKDIGYNVEVLSADYSQRTMSFKISQ